MIALAVIAVVLLVGTIIYILRTVESGIEIPCSICACPVHPSFWRKSFTKYTIDNLYVDIESSPKMSQEEYYKTYIEEK